MRLPSPGPLGLAVLALLSGTLGMPYNESLTDYNMNINQNAQTVLEYDSTRPNKTYTPSPTNWRDYPIYTILLDKFADGEPGNNDYFKTMFENDWREVNLRFGGDVRGLMRRLDYIQGMGVGCIFIAGTPFLNMPWQADSYSPIDFSVLDPHWGNIDDWRALTDAIHARGMYLMLDFTVGTMGDMIGFEGHLNTSTPFSINEYNAVWKKPRYTPWGIEEYPDFKIKNTINDTCKLPTMWNDAGEIVPIDKTGCYASEFDQYGDMEAFGVHPDWNRQLSKFASVQDRLREWNVDVRAKIQVFSCLAIKALDIDAIRIDKATQVTVDALADWSAHTRQCAKEMGKSNFFIVGEVTGGDTFGALYLGRGRTPTQRPTSFEAGANLTSSQNQYFLRDSNRHSLDSVAFHYSVYRALSRILGMDGNLQVAYDTIANFFDVWTTMGKSNDFLNAETGEFDPRHMYGISNFDVFRWPSIVNGTQKQMLGTFINSLLMPGIPLIYYGEEQDFYLFDNGASNYLFGRQPMTSSQAWQRHGCYKLGSEQYFNMRLEKSLLGCEDDWNSLDHFDPSAGSRRMMAHFHYLRKQYPVLTDGFRLLQNGNWTSYIQLPGSNKTETEIGWWSVSRSPLASQSNFNSTVRDIWMIFTNMNVTESYTYDCNSALWVSTPWVGGTTIRNLFYPFETYTLQDSQSSFNNNGQAPWVGCLPSVTLQPYSYKAFVPVANWVAPPPMLTRFSPGHDVRLHAESGDTNATTVDIVLEFTTEMSCTSVTNGLSFNVSSSGHGSTPTINTGSVQCGNITNPIQPTLPGDTPSAWSWSGTLNNVPDGIIEIRVNNVAAADGQRTTGSTDHFLLRKGSSKNVMVFPDADYDNEAFGYSDGSYTFTHSAIGADRFRYSWNYGKNWTDWTAYEDKTTIPGSVFNPTDDMFWEGEHLIVQYWSELAGSSTAVVHADRGFSNPRRVPQFIARGPFNTWGFDKGISAQMVQNEKGLWELPIMATWPSYVQLNVFGYDDYFYGDTNGDGVMDRLPPNSATPNYLNMSAPPKPYLSWALFVDDKTQRWYLEPRGNSAVGAIMYALLLSIPMITAVIAVVIFRRNFYQIRINQWGTAPKADASYFPILGALGIMKANQHSDDKGGIPGTPVVEKGLHGNKAYTGPVIGWPENPNKRRQVLISTLEYEIIDWKLKVKIGGLGVMSSLMGKSMTDCDIYWVVPKVKDLEYPAGDPADPIEVIIFGEPYLIEVEYHVLDNITYIILDSPVFRAQTKADPYPARMDDLSSAIFYSTWNQAIAETVRRFPVIDIYHINDYHGALAPLYLLPRVLPVCLSLHNAEFQGLWPLRTKEEMKEVCSAFNLSKEVCTKYVQFGNTFNLLHAAASFISVHQKSVGVAGVSDKYGKRSWARYPALWTLKHVDSLPNPDPSDIAALDEKPVDMANVAIDQTAEAQRPEHKRQAQEWAKIKQDPKADLFVFVGRWSKQKGVDVIADAMPSLLEKRPSIQLIAVGPVIDLYGRFAAEKLARLMEMYPDRVFSKPEFTALPPFLFSGADFALIPSRDEPFGLVAVEFGRKGALGVGSRLGGLGLMPGWWFPVESTSTNHMLSQFTKTIKLALKSTEEERAMLRARSAVQRFPVVEWRQRTEDFHRRSINTSRRLAGPDAWSEKDCIKPGQSGNRAIQGMDTEDWNPLHKPEPTQPNWDAQSTRSGISVGDTLHAPRAGHQTNSSRASFQSEASDYEDHSRAPSPTSTRPDDFGGFLNRANKAIAREHKHVADPFIDDNAAPNRPFGMHSRVSSVESISSIMDEKGASSPLNKAMASFTDADGEVAQAFVAKLQLLTPENSSKELSIEKFLTKSEEAFFDKVKQDKINSSAASIRSRRDSSWGTPSHFDSRPASPAFPQTPGTPGEGFDTKNYSGPLPNENDTPNMTALQISMQRTFYGWPLYTIIIAIGQMLGATSFQITLLSGQNWQTNLQLYVLGGIFLAASVVWWALFRLKPSVYVLSAPWIFFFLAFFIIGIPALSDSLTPYRQAFGSAATWAYAVASAAAFLFFGLNFGEEAGAATEVWTMRACIVQGSQQIWVAALWYWGYRLNGSDPNVKPPWWTICILWPLAFISLFFGYCLMWGLPEYYRQVPPKVPNFAKTLFRRHIVVWFLASEILRDYWLSGPYGRNWSFLWNSPIPKWAILLLIIAFFIGVWFIMMYILTRITKTHTWFLPIFAVGLGAPRWCQMLWGTSSLALYIPWAGRAGPYLGTSLWLWLGVLDAIQGVGLGMILLQTLSRLHVCATLALAQVIGSVCVMVARATAPNRIGPGSVFPDAAKWDFSDGLKGSPMASAPFWVALVSQLVIVFGYFWFYRKEQLARP
ncbi:alpha-1,3-glucan synthase [Rhizoctonia solani]|uniref:alpha-1,3-glucan synthase n=1 Tax=Rhizoctonia solani TaxID=456999 RepID=A0A0K6GEM4_9AGAM|nr:alpha-1,3-glucan synthase [Rhizoctonia solani]